MIEFNELRLDNATGRVYIDAMVRGEHPGVAIEGIFVDSVDTWVPDGPSSKPVFSRLYDEGKPVRRAKLCLDKYDLDTDPRNNLLFVYVIAADTGEITRNRTYFEGWSEPANFEGKVCDGSIHIDKVLYGNAYLIGKAASNCVVKVSGLQEGQTLSYGNLDVDLETVHILSDGIYPIRAAGTFRGFYASFTGECDIDITLVSTGFTRMADDGVGRGCSGIRRIGTIVDMGQLYTQAMSHVRSLEKDCGNHKAFADWILRFNAFELAVKTGNHSLAIEYWNKYLKGKADESPRATCGCCHG